MAPASRSCGRRTQLICLHVLDWVVVGLLLYATTMSYLRGTYIAHATITLEDTYKIAGISGGPIAGKINKYRKMLLHIYYAGSAVYALASLIYLISACTEYYRRHRPEEFIPSAWQTVFAALYFLAWSAAMTVACIGAFIWGLDWTGTKLKGASFEAKQGAKIAAVAAGFLLVIGLWRLIMHSMRADSQPKEASSQSMTQTGGVRVFV